MEDREDRIRRENDRTVAPHAADVNLDVDVQGSASHSGTGFLTRNVEVRPRRR